MYAYAYVVRVDRVGRPFLRACGVAGMSESNGGTMAREHAYSDAEAERIIEARVRRRLATDRAYLFAEDAEAQAEREAQITEQEERAFYAGHAAGNSVYDEERDDA
jgi:hypothetical protein